jgi:S1-C subfamily serine protease
MSFEDANMPARIGYIVALVILISAFSAEATSRKPEMPTLAPIVERVLPGVVSIAVHGHAPDQEAAVGDPLLRQFFGIPENAEPPKREFWAAGSGVIVDASQGLVLTNRHVLENAEDVTVVLADGRRMAAESVGADSDIDIAVLRVAPRQLVTVPFGNSDDLRVGDYVIAVGNPFGLGQTVTMGLVSALGRSGVESRLESFIQTDASINVGNSGGALIDMKGELVGINTALFGPTGLNIGIGFAIRSMWRERLWKFWLERARITGE